MAKSEGNVWAEVDRKSLSELQSILGNPYTPKSVKEAVVAEIRKIEARYGKKPVEYNSEGFSRSVSELVRMEEEADSGRCEFFDMS